MPFAQKDLLPHELSSTLKPTTKDNALSQQSGGRAYEGLSAQTTVHREEVAVGFCRHG